MIEGKSVLFEHPKEVWVRHSYNVSETPQCVSYFKKRGMQFGIDMMPPPLYQQYPIPINKAKADDLRKLVASFVPTEYQEFFIELPTENKSDED